MASPPWSWNQAIGKTCALMDALFRLAGLCGITRGEMLWAWKAYAWKFLMASTFPSISTDNVIQKNV